jgi:hypothetical protein
MKIRRRQQVCPSCGVSDDLPGLHEQLRLRYEALWAQTEQLVAELEHLRGEEQEPAPPRLVPPRVLPRQDRDIIDTDLSALPPPPGRRGSSSGA